MNDLKVGSVIWKFDENRRMYTTPKPGDLRGSLIWREHWVKRYIVGETSRSWIVSYSLNPKHGFEDVKIPKKGPMPRGWATSEAEIDQLAWLQEHRGKISDFVVRINDPERLRAVAQAAGYVWGAEK